MTDQKTTSKTALQEYLEAVTRVAPNSYEAIVLKYGKHREPVHITVDGAHDKQCFANAGNAALGHWVDYVEGFAFADKCPIPVHHAWNLKLRENSTRTGISDPTWGNEGLAYFGIQFTTEYLRRVTLGSKTWGVLDYFARAEGKAYFQYTRLELVEKGIII